MQRLSLVILLVVSPLAGPNVTSVHAEEQSGIDLEAYTPWGGARRPTAPEDWKPKPDPAGIQRREKQAEKPRFRAENPDRNGPAIKADVVINELSKGDKAVVGQTIQIPIEMPFRPGQLLDFFPDPQVEISGDALGKQHRLRHTAREVDRMGAFGGSFHLVVHEKSLYLTAEREGTARVKVVCEWGPDEKWSREYEIEVIKKQPAAERWPEVRIVVFRHHPGLLDTEQRMAAREADVKVILEAVRNQCDWYTYEGSSGSGYELFLRARELGRWQDIADKFIKDGTLKYYQRWGLDPAGYGFVPIR